MMKTEIQLHIVIDREGIRSVQIIGPPEGHLEGHDIYFRIRDLVLKLDKEIQERFRQGEKENKKPIRENAIQNFGSNLE